MRRNGGLGVDRARAGTKGGAKRKPTGTQRKTAAEIVARNSEIAKLREVGQLMWEEIAARFGIGLATAKRGYDDHLAGREYAATFEQAMTDMREYVAVIQRNRQALAKIAHELPELLPVGAEESDEQRVARISAAKQRPQVRIAAIHEQADLIFKEIALRQAIGDLPADFDELVATRDFDWVFTEIMVVLLRGDAVPGAVHDGLQFCHSAACG